MCRTGTHRTRRRWEVVGEGGIVSRCYRLITKPGCLLHRMSSGSRSTSSLRGNEIHRLFHFCPTYCVCPSASLPQLPKKARTEYSAAKGNHRLFEGCKNERSTLETTILLFLLDPGNNGVKHFFWLTVANVAFDEPVKIMRCYAQRLKHGCALHNNVSAGATSGWVLHSRCQLSYYISPELK